MAKVGLGKGKMKFDYCIQVPGDKLVYMVDDTLKSKTPIEHWGDYIRLGRPAINVVTQKDADLLKTVHAFGQSVITTQKKSVIVKSAVEKPIVKKFDVSLLPAPSSSVLVIIPTLNRPVMCRRAITSLLRQKFTNWSLVIAKNGRTHVKEYLKALDDVLSRPKITYLALPGQGLGYALNEGVALYEDHNYFAVLEDDDEWDPRFLLRLVAIGDSTQGDVIHCQQRQTPMKRQGDGVPVVRKEMHGHNVINFPMCLFRTSLVEKVGQFCNEAGPATDWDWNLRCINAGAQYTFVQEVLVTHHWHNSNYCMTHNGNDFIRARQKKGVYGVCE